MPPPPPITRGTAINHFIILDRDGVLRANRRISFRLYRTRPANEGPIVVPSSRGVLRGGKKIKINGHKYKPSPCLSSNSVTTSLGPSRLRARPRAHRSVFRTKLTRPPTPAQISFRSKTAAAGLGVISSRFGTYIGTAHSDWPVLN